MSTTGPESGQAVANKYLMDGVPDWDAIGFDLHCSRCGYNLRMLTKPRCTECGFDFDWREAIAHHLTVNPRLFEHGWRRRPVRAYLGTVVGATLRPRRFWGGVSLHDRIRTLPLMFMLLTAPLWLIAVVACVGPITGFAIDEAFGFTDANRARMSGSWSNPDPRSRYYANLSQDMWDWCSDLKSITRLNSSSRKYLNLLAGVLPAQLFMLAILASLSDTIARFKLKQGHMARVVAYSAAPTVIAFGAVLLFVLTPIQAQRSFRPSVLGINIDRWEIPYIVAICELAAASFYLFVGFRRYLRIARPLLAAILMAVLEVLCSSIILMLVA